MKWILVVGYYLVSLGGGGPDVHVKVYPETFKTQEECAFMKDLIITKYAKYQSTDVQCIGVQP